MDYRHADNPAPFSKKVSHSCCLELSQLRTRIAELEAENALLREDVGVLGKDISKWMNSFSDATAKLRAVEVYAAGLRDALAELCRLKVTKEIEGKTEKYLKAQPVAWNKAIQILNSTPPDLSEVEGMVLVPKHWASNIWYASEMLKNSDNVLDRNESAALKKLYALFDPKYAAMLAAGKDNSYED